MGADHIELDQALARVLNIRSIPAGISIWTILNAAKEEAIINLQNAAQDGDPSDELQLKWNKVQFSEQRLTMARTLISRIAPTYTPWEGKPNSIDSKIRFMVNKGSLYDFLRNEFDIDIHEWAPSGENSDSPEDHPDFEADTTEWKLPTTTEGTPNLKRLQTEISKLQRLVGLFIDYFADTKTPNISKITRDLEAQRTGQKTLETDQTRRKLLSTCREARKNAGFNVGDSKTVENAEYEKLNLDRQWIEYFEDFPSRLGKKEVTLN